MTMLQLAHSVTLPKLGAFGLKSALRGLLVNAADYPTEGAPADAGGLSASSLKSSEEEGWIWAEAWALQDFAGHRRS